MNKRERRAYLDRMRKNQTASLCPSCHQKTRHMTIPSPEDPSKVDILCEYCSRVVMYGVVGYEPWKLIKLPAT